MTMPLLRGIARTAAIAGTATAVSNRVSRRQAGKWSQQQQQQPAPQYQQAPQYQTPAPPPVDPTTARLAQLKQLGELKAQGLLTEQEFAAQKARILAT